MSSAEARTVVLVRVAINDTLFVLCAVSLSLCLYKIAKMSLANIYLESKVTPPLPPPVPALTVLIQHECPVVPPSGIGRIEVACDFAPPLREDALLRVIYALYTAIVSRQRRVLLMHDWPHCAAFTGWKRSAAGSPFFTALHKCFTQIMPRFSSQRQTCG